MGVAPRSGTRLGTTRQQLEQARSLKGETKNSDSDAGERVRSYDDYRVGWLCVHDFELQAARAALDEEHDILGDSDPDQDGPLDAGQYILGRMGGQLTVLAKLRRLSVSMKGLTQELQRIFKGITIFLLVGCGSATWDDRYDGSEVRLGDVVIGLPEKQTPGCFKSVSSLTSGSIFRLEPVIRGSLAPPPEPVLSAVTHLGAKFKNGDGNMDGFIAVILDILSAVPGEPYAHPGQAQDILWCPQCGTSCSARSLFCPGHKFRNPRQSSAPMVHSGPIASASQQLYSDDRYKSTRESLYPTYGALCIEKSAFTMEDAFECLVIRGISNYADNRGFEGWDRYAAVTAAACAKEVLFYLPEKTRRLMSIMEQTREETTTQSFGQIDSSQAPSADKQLNAEGIPSDTERRSSNVSKFDLTVTGEVEEQRVKVLELLRMLKTTDYESAKNSHPPLLPDTGDWVLNSPELRHWLDHDTLVSVLWISGDPGCGKSVVARSLVDDELQQLAESGWQVAYFFFNEDDVQRSTIQSALRSLLHQVFSQDLALVGWAVSNMELDEDTVLERFEQLLIILIVASQQLPKGIAIILDGLDECDLRGRSFLAQELVGLARDFARGESVKAKMKILITGRPYADLEKHFNEPSMPRIRGEWANEDIREDVSRYINHRLSEYSSWPHIAEIRANILEQNSRTYLWPKMVIDFLVSNEDRLNMSDLHSVPNISTYVSSAYRKLLGRIEKRFRPMSERIFSLMIGARRPLDYDSIISALKLSNEFEDELESLSEPASLRLCCGLLIYSEEDGVDSDGAIHFLHPAMKEFLVGYQPSNRREKPYQKMQVEMIMATTCIDSIKSPYDDFQDYAARYWFDHVGSTNLDDLTDQPGREEDLKKLYDVTGVEFRRWFPSYWRQTKPGQPVPGSINAWHLAGIIELDDILVEVLDLKNPEDSPGVSDLDDKGNSPLNYACMHGLWEEAELMRCSGADVNQRTASMYGNALQAACHKGQIRLVEWLLSHHADVNA